ncbi:uncharacterized protein FMAN_12276 [Fusarium mangiferae]|uniref:LisH domain-containing protein n=1 Tax=Fusarium mangiferae TaxID=192010 RepID=A0A1L7TSE9_FUSMA|nr:uncharacterized protein FMAN_12276 [Fusarium mangiferae]CVK98227.1 uncharacterized protein FMAN_12276 [Fusarium mangiferae]
MFRNQQAFPGQLPSNMDYHALLHSQIYEYFLSAGMYSCGQALLNSDYNLRHQVMHAAAQRCTNEPRNATPSLLDSGFGSSYSSPYEEQCPTEPVDLSKSETEPALYQWFCTFWDALNSTQAQATSIPVQDSCLSYPPDLPQHLSESDPTINPDFLGLLSGIDVIESSPSEVESFTLQCASWPQIAAHSDTASITSRKRRADSTPYSDTTSITSRETRASNAGLLSFQKVLDGLIKHNEGMLKELRSQEQNKTAKRGTKRPDPSDLWK